MFNKVFISYAKEDKEVAEKIYTYLQDNNYEPWMDDYKLLPGQNWDNEIRAALKKADYIILLLSNTSVAKRGYVQREFKLALDYCEEKLDDDIYVIPCKVDNCEVPNRLSKYHWAELLTKGFDTILLALNTQRSKYEAELFKRTSSSSALNFSERKISKIISGPPNVSIDITYPQFVSDNIELATINNDIENSALKAYTWILNPEEILFTDDNSPIVSHQDYNIDFGYKFEYLSKEVISLISVSSWYTGGAHGMYNIIGYNYKLNPFTKISLYQIFEGEKAALNILHNICKREIIGNIRSQNIEGDEDNIFLSEEPLAKEWSTFNNFHINKDGLTIIFNVYQETAYVFGAQEVYISFDELIVELPQIRTLKKLQGSLH